MARYLFIFKLMVVTILLGLLCTGQPIGAESPSASDTTDNQDAPARDNSKESSGSQMAVQFSEHEIQAIAGALPDGETRQMFNEKVATGEGADDATFDEDTIRSGRGICAAYL